MFPGYFASVHHTSDMESVACDVDISRRSVRVKTRYANDECIIDAQTVDIRS